MMIITLVINESYSYHFSDFSGDEIHLEIESETEVENELEVEAAIENLSFMCDVNTVMNIHTSINKLKTLYIGVNYPPPEPQQQNSI